MREVVGRQMRQGINHILSVVTMIILSPVCRYWFMTRMGRTLSLLCWQWRNSGVWESLCTCEVSIPLFLFRIMNTFIGFQIHGVQWGDGISQCKCLSTWPLYLTLPPPPSLPLSLLFTYLTVTHPHLSQPSISADLLTLRENRSQTQWLSTF